MRYEWNHTAFPNQLLSLSNMQTIETIKRSVVARALRGGGMNRWSIRDFWGGGEIILYDTRMADT